MMAAPKYTALCAYLKNLTSVAVAFSGGVDSTLLLKAAVDALGKQNVLAVTARSLSFPQRELKEAARYAASLDVEHVVIDSEELDLPGFEHNPKNRCYLCKKELFGKIRALAEERGLEAIVEGSNRDDEGDYRPGLLAIAELGIQSPLRAVGLTKTEIRQLSRELNLPTWDKPSFACLASRIPYGDTISPKKLAMIDAAEQFLLDQGFGQVRVRVHGDLARIETDESGFQRLAEKALREKIHERFKAIGFSYIALDLLGYRTGSMNETLAEK